MIELVLIFGVWMNVYSIDFMHDNRYGCWVHTAGNKIVLSHHTCDEVAQAIQKALKDD